MLTLSEFQLGWVIGIIDGEGCLKPRKDSGNGRYYPRVSVGMDDEDIVRKLENITGIGSVYGPYSYSPNWAWRVNGADALEFMRKIEPHLGERKKLDVLRLDVLIHKSYKPQRTRLKISIIQSQV